MSTTKHTTLDQLRMLATRTKGELGELQGYIDTITINKQASAEDGHLATYQLFRDGEAVGAKINIPKDFLVKSADIFEVTVADTPYEGALVGDKYVDFVINSLEGTANESHIYLPVNDLVDNYVAGEGIDISAANIVTVKIDAAGANGLTKSANGLAMSLATIAAAGAMSAADKTKLDGLVAATDTEVDTMLDDVFGAEDEE